MSREQPRPPKHGYQRFRFVVGYDGTDYYGWQRVGTTHETVQHVLEKALSTVFDEHITVVGSGRTDAGVHALAQQAHFDAIPDPKRIKQLNHAMRRLVPPSIVVKGIWLAPPQFHAIWSVERKTYTYRLNLGASPQIFNYRYSTWLHHSLDLDLLCAHSQFLVKNQDFKSFMNGGSPVKSTIREIYQADWSVPKPDQLLFTITGNGFLKQMVRNIVGTLIELNKQKSPPTAMQEILAARDRRKAFWTAPARGLALSKVFYPRELDIQCRKI